MQLALHADERVNLSAVTVCPREIVERVQEHTQVVDVVRFPLRHIAAPVVPPLE